MDFKEIIQEYQSFIIELGIKTRDYQIDTEDQISIKSKTIKCSYQTTMNGRNIFLII